VSENGFLILNQKFLIKIIPDPEQFTKKREKNE
jgi:hypothetical protein